jgi:hypothetical protein
MLQRQLHFQQHYFAIVVVRRISASVTGVAPLTLLSGGRAGCWCESAAIAQQWLLCLGRIRHPYV